MTQHFGTPATSAPFSPETAESIKQKYETNLNTNAFTDAYKTKLDSLNNGLIDQNGGQELQVWTGTQVQYDAILLKDPNVLYLVKP